MMLQTKTVAENGKRQVAVMLPKESGHHWWLEWEVKEREGEMVGTVPHLAVHGCPRIRPSPPT